MPRLQTLHFGVIEYAEDTVIEFPEGLPAFESEFRFVAIEPPETAPVIFLQSMATPPLVFLTLPVHLVDPAYRFLASSEDLEALGLRPDRQPEPGTEVMGLALITVTEDRTATANLMAPILINLATRQARQVIQSDSGYSYAYPLLQPGREEKCS